jgi:hypothetical protein
MSLNTTPSYPEDPRLDGEQAPSLASPLQKAIGAVAAFSTGTYWAVQSADIPNSVQEGMEQATPWLIVGAALYAGCVCLKGAVQGFFGNSDSRPR